MITESRITRPKILGHHLLERPRANFGESPICQACFLRGFKARCAKSPVDSLVQPRLEARAFVQVLENLNASNDDARAPTLPLETGLTLSLQEVQKQYPQATHQFAHFAAAQGLDLLDAVGNIGL